MYKRQADDCIQSLRLYRSTPQSGGITLPVLDTWDESIIPNVLDHRGIASDIAWAADEKCLSVQMFDVQISVCRSVGLASIIQALALKAVKIIGTGRGVPSVDSTSLMANRECAIARALRGGFRPATLRDEFAEFQSLYNHCPPLKGGSTSPRVNDTMGSAVQALLFYIRDELGEIGVFKGPFLNPILVSVFGSGGLWRPLTSTAELQLDLYVRLGRRPQRFFRILSLSAVDWTEDWSQDPLAGMPELPDWLLWTQGVEMRILADADRVVAGTSARVTVLLRNTTDRTLSDVSVSYSIHDSNDRVVQNGQLPSFDLLPNQTVLEPIDFPTNQEATEYVVLVSVGKGHGQIEQRYTIHASVPSLRVECMAKALQVDGPTPILFRGEIHTGEAPLQSVRCRIEVRSESDGTIVCQTESDLGPFTSTRATFSSDDFPPLTVSPDALSASGRMVLHALIVSETGEAVSTAESYPFFVMVRPIHDGR